MQRATAVLAAPAAIPGDAPAPVVLAEGSHVPVNAIGPINQLILTQGIPCL